MYLSTIDIIIASLTLAFSSFLVVITAYANRTLLRENRNLRGRVRRQADFCRAYHSPRPF